MRQRDCVIAGVGLTTPLGTTLASTWHALVEGRFITETGRVEIERTDQARVTQLALHAAREALHASTHPANGERSEPGDARTALVVGTSKGPADEWLREPTTAFGLHTLALDLARELNITGPRLTLSAACASGLHAVARALLLLRCGEASRVLVVASESSLHAIWHGTFRRLGVLPPPGEPCRPFDQERNGFIMSEAAAAIVLEARGARAGELLVDNAHIAGDATHLTSNDVDAMTLKHLLRLSAREAPIDFVHAHATATANDAIELSAIDATVGRSQPIVYSHKGALGHTLGASGLIAVALSSKAHETGAVPPLPTTRTPIAAGAARIEPRGKHGARIDTSLVIASGFGGATGVVRLRSQRG